MLNLSIKVRFRRPLLVKNEKAKTRKNQGLMRVFCVSMGYKKDIFAVFAYEFEPLQFLMKSFACAHGEIKGSRLW